MKKVYLIRHAKVQNLDENNNPVSNPPIQFETITDTSIYKNLNVEKVYCSPMTRTIQTAEKIFDEFEVVDYIYEYKAPNLLFGMSKEEDRKFWDEKQSEFRNNSDWKFDNSESFNEMKARCLKFLEFLSSQPYQRIAVVAHGNFFRYLLSVNALGESYTPKIYLDLSRYIKFDNLEIKKMEILI